MLVAALLNRAAPGAVRHEHAVSFANQRLLAAASEYYESGRNELEVRLLLRMYDTTPAVRIDCNWKLAWVLRPLLAEFPEARIVHLVRDPRQNVRSCFNLDYYGTLADLIEQDPLPVLQRFGAWKLGNALGLARHLEWYQTMPRIRCPDWVSLSPFERNCAFWSETHRLILAEASSRPRYMRIKLEDLTTRPESVRALTQFLELPDIPPAVVRQILDRPVNELSIQKAVINAARTTPELPSADQWPAPVLRSLVSRCGEDAAQLGYDL